MAKTPYKFLSAMVRNGLLNWVPDPLILRIRYRNRTGTKLNLKNPVLYSEKMQWIKLYDRRPECPRLADKLLVRDHIREVLGEEFLIPLIAVYNSVEEIDWDTLPDQFVLKCTHGSGSNIICKNKADLDIPLAKKKLKKWMKTNWYWRSREWPYKNLERRIVCEKYITDETGVELKDYKFFCFSGEPKFVQVDFDRYSGHKRNFYDLDWSYMPVSLNHPTDPSKDIPRPQKLDEMIRIAKILSSDYPFVRIDLYSIHDTVYFGEITFFAGGGLVPFYEADFDRQVGDWIKLPEQKRKYKGE